MTVPIVYHGQGIRWSDWSAGRHLSLMKAIARRHPVVILDAPDLAGGPMRRRRPWIEPVHENLTVVRNAFGWRAAKIGRRLEPLSAYIDAAWTRSALRRLGVREYVLWMGSPAPQRTRWMDVRRLVYDCLDPCFDPRFQDDFDARERWLASHARLVFASAELLVERMAGFGARVEHVPNGTGEQFLDAPRLPVPPPLRQRPRPVVGYMGTLDGRFDFAAVETAARALPRMTFCLVGRLNGDQADRSAGLQSLPNVHFAGAASGDLAIAYNQSFDVGLIPFCVDDPLNDALDPVKLYMYFAAGTPVVAAATRECRRRDALVHIAADPTRWAPAIRDAANSPEASRARRIDYARQNTWSIRAESVLRNLAVNGLLTPSAAGEHCPAGLRMTRRPETP